eukprot:TRINITY_DN6633_c0_g1_i3.p1 TRINITY_DN6633_c0_g1~~TRINITY_DN6633_c0_g1_i3.p1  ORF type:complete len:396 (+),score=93.94 TRINITY_DN6633_c0_g1_i3:100-1188(+)
MAAFRIMSSRFQLSLGHKLAIGAVGGTGAFFTAPKTALCDSASTVPPFSIEKPKYDQSTFSGRLKHIQELIDPRTLLLSSDDVKQAQALLAKFKETGKLPAGVSDDDMWKARGIVETSIHPVTGEELLKFGRMSAFVPMNVPLCALMLMAQSPSQVVFTQWLNQTYNSINNYVNRSGAEVDYADLGKSYALAVSASCGIALGAKKLIAAVPALQMFGPFVPYLAVISAGTANVSFTRMEEWAVKGVSICDDDGKDLGVSLKAGQQGVLQTVLTRSCFLPIAPMVMPILGMKLIAPVLPAGAVASAAAELVLITVCISGMLPVALAILPQRMEIPVSSLEPEFQNLKDAKGQPITKVYANKGL